MVPLSSENGLRTVTRGWLEQSMPPTWLARRSNSAVQVFHRSAEVTPEAR
jgi:hypothetical protein